MGSISVFHRLNIYELKINIYNVFITFNRIYNWFKFKLTFSKFAFNLLFKLQSCFNANFIYSKACPN